MRRSGQVDGVVDVHSVVGTAGSVKLVSLNCNVVAPSLIDNET